MRIDQAPTACDAFHVHRASGMGTQQRALILAFIRERGDGWSIGELAHALNLQKSTVSARVNELLNDNELVAFAPRKDRRSGITVRPVGMEAFGQGDLFDDK